MSDLKNIQQIHASAAALEGRGVLILGPSGSGKSTLLLKLLSMGGMLIGDDQIILGAQSGQIWARPHPNAQARLEIRHVGIFKCTEVTEAPIMLAVDLSQAALPRLPKVQYFTYAGIKCPLYFAKDVAAILPLIHLTLTGKIVISLED